MKSEEFSNVSQRSSEMSVREAMSRASSDLSSSDAMEAIGKAFGITFNSVAEMEVWANETARSIKALRARDERSRRIIKHYAAIVTEVHLYG